MGINNIRQDVRISLLTDFGKVHSFHSGVRQMDSFIQNRLELSSNNHYCSTYEVESQGVLIGIFALSFDSLDLDLDDKDELMHGISSAYSPSVDYDYQGTFWAKPRYPSLDIAYLAVHKDWRGKGIGRLLIDAISEKARSQKFAGCQFLTVEALKTVEYSAVSFYTKCGFAACEFPNPNKDTLRMYRTLYV